MRSAWASFACAGFTHVRNWIRRQIHTCVWDKTLPRQPLNQELERRPDLGFIVAWERFELSLQTSPVYYQFATEVRIPRYRMGKKQEVETLINEKAMLFAKYLRIERQTWNPRIVGLA